MTVVIRRAEKSDMETLGHLGAQLMKMHYDFDNQRFLAPGAGTERGYASFLGRVLDSEEECIFVAESDGTIRGYIFAALEPLSWKELRGPAGFIHDILVTDDSRRRGIGSALMNAAIGWLRERGAPRVILGTAARNATAQAMFHHLGFRDTMIEMTLEL